MPYRQQDVNSQGETTQQATPHKPNTFWNSGLVMFIVITAMLIVCAEILPWSKFLIVLVAAITFFLIVGGYQLLQDNKLSQKNYLKLVGDTLKHFFNFVLKRK